MMITKNAWITKPRSIVLNFTLDIKYCLRLLKCKNWDMVSDLDINLRPYDVLFKSLFSYKVSILIPKYY